VRLFSIFRKRFFSKEQEKLIVAAIEAAESNSSGEVRVHFSKKIVTDVFTDAGLVFTKLGMDKTENRNGVLIYVVPSARQFAIIGDRGFHQVSGGNDFWETVRDRMQNFFKDENFVEGITRGLEEVGHIMHKHFPRMDNDVNELNDEISYGE
jgi:uncharacterized membrane protein